MEQDNIVHIPLVNGELSLEARRKQIFFEVGCNHIIFPAYQFFVVHNVRGIYFLLNDEYTIYIGSSNNIGRRIGQHYHRNEIPFLYYAYAHGDNMTMKEIEKIEYEFIEKMRPEYNKKILF